MPTEDARSPIERVQSSYQRLIEAAATLNAASDELGTSIASLDTILKKLNLGVAAWVLITGNEDYSSGYYWKREVGYAKVGGKWGIAISTASGSLYQPDEESNEIWLFNDAPRTYRIDAVEKIPDLLDELIKRANETTESIRGKAAEARQLAEALAPPRPTTSALKRKLEDAMKAK